MEDLVKKYAQFLVKNYGVSKLVSQRLAKVHIDRALRFYVEGNLDSLVIQEDTYNGEDFSCTCKVNEGNKHKKGCSNCNYPNLKYSEVKSKEWKKELFK